MTTTPTLAKNENKTAKKYPVCEIDRVSPKTFRRRATVARTTKRGMTVNLCGQCEEKFGAAIGGTKDLTIKDGTYTFHEGGAV